MLPASCWKELPQSTNVSSWQREVSLLSASQFSIARKPHLSVDMVPVTERTRDTARITMAVAPTSAGTTTVTDFRLVRAHSDEPLKPGRDQYSLI